MVVKIYVFIDFWYLFISSSHEHVICLTSRLAGSLRRVFAVQLIFTNAVSMNVCVPFCSLANDPGLVCLHVE